MERRHQVVPLCRPVPFLPRVVEPVVELGLEAHPVSGIDEVVNRDETKKQKEKTPLPKLEPKQHEYLQSDVVSYNDPNSYVFWPDTLKHGSLGLMAHIIYDNSTAKDEENLERVTIQICLVQIM